MVTVALRPAVSAEPTLFTARAVLLVVLCFLPYAALPVGNNTNVPLSSLLALTFLPTVLAHQRLALLLGAMLLGPMAQTMALTIIGHEVSLAAAIAWALHAAPLVGFAGIALHRSEVIIAPLYWTLASSCGYAVFQLSSIRGGSIPLLGMYDVPGYASVTSQQFAIVTYIRRPFGWFPEPSFLAGTLALGAVLHLTLMASHRRSLTGRDYGLLAAVAGTIYLTQSGSGVLTIGAILLLAVLPLRGTRWVPLAVIGVALAAVKVGSDILSSRTSTGQNFSWGDRLGSLVAAGEYVYGSSAGWLIGIGKGSLNDLFLRGEIHSSSGGGRALDTASVVLRLFYELGLPLGLLIVGGLVMAIVRGNRSAVGGVGVALVLGTWLLVAGATITYDSAAMIWAVPGVALGLVASSTQTAAKPLRGRSLP